jgi:allophanate hydrolase
MGARLQGASLAPATALDIPSEPIVRGSVQVSGDGVPTVLLADHQTTGGYPKIATVIDADLDGFTQLRPGDYLGFVEVDPATAVRAARLKAKTVARYLEALARGI